MKKILRTALHPPSEMLISKGCCCYAVRAACKIHRKHIYINIIGIRGLVLLCRIRPKKLKTHALGEQYINHVQHVQRFAETPVFIGERVLHEGIFLRAADQFSDRF